MASISVLCPDVDKAIEYAPSSESDVLLRAYILRAGHIQRNQTPRKGSPDLEKPASWLPTRFRLYIRKPTPSTLSVNTREAKTDFMRLQRINNRAPESYIGLARIAVKQNNLGIANEMLAQAVNLDPNNAENIRAQGVGTQADG